ncbi:hypothetical protein CFP65_6394 [Kitasatospora sp. MMS16-BH015]|uniref:hypothetical protein n=1 Tax=Kitasatospora sp. MMS16-BH015 TaxID=2018025 RepID=UPI000CA37395|nr:hypothetical protein [Kitasatospora sp. MMS16-BH015]AUG81050.1 hypothetical protein CFP65_6394 [Kitasatospora sp. MMS16-BH015]
MGLTRMAIAGLVGAGTLVGAPLLGFGSGSAAPNSPGKDVEPAWVSPAEASPGQSVQVSVTCETSSVKTITANSQAFSTGSATLTVGPDGKYAGSALLASKEEFAGKGPDKAGKGNSWGIDGSCPNGDTFTGAVQVNLAGKGSGGTGGTGSWSPDTSTGSSGSSNSWSQGSSGGEKSPHGAVHTGLGGSVGAPAGQLATGGALLAAGVGGFWALRRRNGDDGARL